MNEVDEHHDADYHSDLPKKRAKDLQSGRVAEC
jgi:hypothetical protein